MAGRGAAGARPRAGRKAGPRREPVTAAEAGVLALVCVAFLGAAAMARDGLVRGLETRQAVRDALDDFGYVVGAAEAGYRLEERRGPTSSRIVATCFRGVGAGKGAPGCGALPPAPGVPAGAVEVAAGG